MAQHVLDLDLDFFVLPTEHFRSGHQRLPGSRFSCSRPEEVEQFLERQCGLSKSEKIPGRFCIDHDEAFDTWREWISKGAIETPFDVDHVDAHADHGLGDSSWVYLLTEILALPVGKRAQPRRGLDGLNFGKLLGVRTCESVDTISDLRLWSRHPDGGWFSRRHSHDLFSQRELETRSN